MNGNCFIDTNILVYCYTGDEPEKQQKAINIARATDTFISTQVLTELSNTLKRKFKLDWQTIESVISEVSSVLMSLLISLRLLRMRTKLLTSISIHFMIR